jgi:hypothetical protein
LKKISKSPNRGTFHSKTSKVLDEFYSNWNEIQDAKEQDPEWQKNNLEYDLRTCDWILEKVRNSDSYAQNLYAAMCNMQWCKNDMWPILKEEYWHCSWRYSGGIVANMRQEGDYIDWYCSGMGGLAGSFETEETLEQYAERTGFVSEGTVTEEIKEDLKRLGWINMPYPEDDK